ncbi:MAG: GNAT family acetyltransferase [Candidatus Cloacimonetes bacterium]|nr:GNAT family acetyltransferase [Candidatus Cloacimonadota bacterium]
MIIRPFRWTDADEVIKLWRECGLIIPQNNALLDIKRKMQVNPEWLLVGELAGKVIATCMAGYEGHRGWINYLAILPSLQGKGYAREIMTKAEELLKTAGCPKINLQVRSGNLKVIEFYKRIGYKDDGVISLGKRLVSDENT